MWKCKRYLILDNVYINTPHDDDKLYDLPAIFAVNSTVIKDSFVKNQVSLKELAKNVTPLVPSWLKEWEEKYLSIVIVDWFNLTNYVPIIRNINVRKGKS